jgi:hypothetical protein
MKRHDHDTQLCALTGSRTVFERDGYKEPAEMRERRKWPKQKCGPDGANGKASA